MKFCTVIFIIMLLGTKAKEGNTQPSDSNPSSFWAFMKDIGASPLDEQNTPYTTYKPECVRQIAVAATIKYLNDFANMLTSNAETDLYTQTLALRQQFENQFIEQAQKCIIKQVNEEQALPNWDSICFFKALGVTIKTYVPQAFKAIRYLTASQLLDVIRLVRDFAILLYQKWSECVKEFNIQQSQTYNIDCFKKALLRALYEFYPRIIDKMRQLKPEQIAAIVEFFESARDFHNQQFKNCTNNETETRFTIGGTHEIKCYTQSLIDAIMETLPKLIHILTSPKQTILTDLWELWDSYNNTFAQKYQECVEGNNFAITEDSKTHIDWQTFDFTKMLKELQ